MTIITPLSGGSVYQSDSLLVKAAVTLNGQALLSAQVTGSIDLGDGTAAPLDLYDDGNHEDGAVDDGIYAGRITLYGSGTMPTSGNPYTLTVTATTSTGIASDRVDLTLAASDGAPSVNMQVSGPSAPDYFAGEEIIITATLSYPDSSIHTDTAVTVTVTAPDLSVAQVGLTNVASDTWQGTYPFAAEQGGLYYLDVRANPPAGSGFVDGWDGAQVEVYRGALALNVTDPPGTYYRAMAVPLTVCVTTGAQPAEDAEVSAAITPGDNLVELVHTTGGCYSGDYYPIEGGAHQVTFTAHSPQHKSGSATGSFIVLVNDPALVDAVTEFADGAIDWSEETMDVSQDVAETGDWFAAKVVSDKVRMMIEFSMDAIELLMTGVDTQQASGYIRSGLPGAAEIDPTDELLEAFLDQGTMHALSEVTSEGMDEVIMSFARAPYRYYATGGSPNTELIVPRDYIEDQYTAIVSTTQSLQSNFYGPLDTSVTQFQTDIDSRAAEVTANLPSFTTEQTEAYITDFTRRQHAHQWLAHYDLFARSDLMFEVQAKREDMEEDRVRELALFFSEFGLKVGLTGFFGPVGEMASDSFMMAYHAYVNTRNIEQDQHFRDIAVGLMGRAHGAQAFIGSNTLSGLNLVERATPPQTPGGEIVSSDIVRTTPGYSLGFITQDVYADLQIENTGSVSADYGVVAYYTTPQYPGSYRQVLREMTDPATGEQLGPITLSPGSQETVRITFVEDDGDDYGLPKYGVYFILYALTGRGAYVLDVETVAPFDPRTEIAARATQMASVTSPSLRSANATTTLSLGDTISQTDRYPVRAMVGADIEQFTYTLSIAVDNPFPMPLAVVISQTIPSTVTITDAGDGVISGDEITWHRMIQPRNTVLLDYTFDYNGDYAAEATLPPAYMRFYDAVDDVTVTLNTGLVSFYARSPLRARAIASTIVAPEAEQTAPVTVTNMDSASAQQGDLTLHIWTITGMELLSTTTPVSLGAGASQGYDLTYTSPDEGLYVLEILLHYEGQEALVMSDLLTVEGGQIYLPLVLDNYAPGSEPTNHVPYVPSSPSPADGATGQGLDIELSWAGGDPDGDDVTYDVYLETDDTTPDVLVCNDVASASCDPGTLSAGEQHHWRVVATDAHDATTTGPVWDFTTQVGPRVLYVATSGADAANDCDDSVDPCATVQHAVDLANPGDEIRVSAGTYSDLHVHSGVTQVVYISKTVNIRGGYVLSNWTTPDPVANPTTLDAQGQGRGMYIVGAISPTVEGLRITGGDATGLGGGSSGQDTGAGIYLITAAAVIRDNEVFENGSSFYGGGIYLSSSPATICDNTIYSNTASHGAGISLRDSSARLCGNIVTANTATGFGGGLNVVGGAPTVVGNAVTSNTSTAIGYGGGGIYLYDSDATLSGNRVSLNVGASGGGLYLRLGTPTLINNLVTDNQVINRGSGLYLGGASPYLLHNTMARNTGGDGAGINVNYWLSNYSSPVLTNTILVGQDVGITVGNGNTATLEATAWGSGAWANGTDWEGTGTIITGTLNYWGDPAFVAPDTGDYHIGAFSVARDAGVDSGVANDIDGEARPYGTDCDIGADEYWP